MVEIQYKKVWGNRFVFVLFYTGSKRTLCNCYKDANGSKRPAKLFHQINNTLVKSFNTENM